MNKDIIFIEKLKINTKIGIEPWERQNLQPVELDLKLTADITPAAQSDDLNQTLNYQTLHDKLIEFVNANECFLIEALAENIAAFILHNFSVGKVWLKLAKPQALKHAANVGVIVEREPK